jgi:hypothetical protein
MWNFLTTVFVVIIGVWIFFGMTPKEVGRLVKNGVTTVNELVTAEEWKENLKDSQKENKESLMKIFDKTEQHKFRYKNWVGYVNKKCHSERCDFTKIIRAKMDIKTDNKFIPKTLMQEYEFDRIVHTLENIGYNISTDKKLQLVDVIVSYDKTTLVFNVSDMKNYNLINFMRVNKIDELGMENYNYYFKYEYNTDNKFNEKLQSLGVDVKKSHDKKAYFTMIFTKKDFLKL